MARDDFKKGTGIYRFDKRGQQQFMREVTFLGDAELRMFDDVKRFVKKEVVRDISGVWN